MSAEQITAAQIAREITGQMKFLIRFQRQIPAPAFLHESVPAEWLGLTLVGDRLIDSYGYAGRVLSKGEIEQLVAMTPENEEDFWRAYADEMDLLGTQSNTDPQIACFPAQNIQDGLNIGEQMQAFLTKFM